MSSPSSSSQPNKNNKRPRPTAADASARPEEEEAGDGGTNHDIFANLKEWVLQQQEGAWVHPAVTMRPEDRTLVVTEEIAQGTTLLRLPVVQVPPPSPTTTAAAATTRRTRRMRNSPGTC